MVAEAALDRPDAVHLGRSFQSRQANTKNTPQPEAMFQLSGGKVEKKKSNILDLSVMADDNVAYVDGLPMLIYL